MEGVVIDNKERKAMTAMVEDEIRIYNDIRLIEAQEELKREGMEPDYYDYHVPKLIDVTEANSTTDERFKQIFCITSITNNTASTYGREIAIAGRFLEEQPDIDWKKTQFFIVIGNRSHRALCLGEWVFSCTAMFHVPGTVNFYLSLDGRTPISQILKFDYISTPTNLELFSTVVGFRQQLCLAHLLFSKSKIFDMPSCIPPSPGDALLLKCILSLCDCTKTATFIHLIQNHGFPLVHGESLYLRFLLEQKLSEWISERLQEECVKGTRNFQGLGVIHMLAIMGYRWLIRMYSELGRGRLSLDFADVAGWTALHWAAFFNRNQTAQLLIDMGANPTIVTLRTIEFPDGLTVVEVASRNGHHKLAAHLADMTEEYLKRTKMGGNCESRKRRFEDTSLYGQAIKIQAAFRSFRVKTRAKKHDAGSQSIGEQDEGHPRIGNMLSQL